MTLGPPSSAAGPSNNNSTKTSSTPLQSSRQQATPAPGVVHPSPTAAAPSVPPTPSLTYTSQFPVQQHYGQSNPPATSAGPHSGPTSGMAPYPPHSSYYPQQSGSQPPSGGYSYYGYPSNAWSNAWNANAYQYPAGSGYPYSYGSPQTTGRAPQATSQQMAQATPQVQAVSAAPALHQKAKSRSPSPPPPPEYHKDWDVVIKTFLSAIGFSQALKGFEADMIVLNPDWEQKKVPGSLRDLATGLSKLTEGKTEDQGEEMPMNDRPLEDRKLDNVRWANGVTPRSPSSLTGEISRFLARNRARNDASNRNEFLLSLAEKRRRLNESGDAEASSAVPSCARTDAKTQNRDVQMKYDIAKNEGGPLQRTVQSSAAVKAEANATHIPKPEPDQPSAERHPALDERLENIEKHFSVRYVPSPPRSLLDRLKFLEDHIVYLEKEYPPWAALHFNQPNRGWPPPPRATPIVVPSHLTSTAFSGVEQSGSFGSTPGGLEGGGKGKGKGRTGKSSLHRAVMEKLEVQKAMQDLAGGG